MAPWLVSLLILLTGALTSFGTWLRLRDSLRRLQSDFEARLDTVLRVLDEFRQEMSRYHIQRTGVLNNCLQAHQEWLEAKMKGEEGWMGVFLPTDESAAATERQIRASEDRAISATEPTHYSSLDSPRSVPTSRRGPSTRPAPTSGKR